MTDTIKDPASLEGTVTWELRAEDGTLKRSGVVHNLITDTGDQMYAERGAGLAGAPAAPTGMKLGSGSAAVTKTGTGAALGTYIANSHQAFASTPASAKSGTVRRITYTATWAAGKATTASTIAEAVIVNDALADATSSAANTVARVLLPGLGTKGATDTLSLTWTHDLGTP